MRIVIEFDTLDAVAQKVLRALTSIPPEGLDIGSGPPKPVPVTVWAPEEKLEEAAANVPISTEPEVVKIEKEAIPKAEKPKVEKAKATSEVSTQQTPPPVEQVSEDDLQARKMKMKTLFVKLCKVRELSASDGIKVATEIAGVSSFKDIPADRIDAVCEAFEKEIARVEGAPAPEPAAAEAADPFAGIL